MKSEDKILDRLKKLRIKYARKYVSETQDRSHQNCLHNCINGPMTFTKSDYKEFVKTPVDSHDLSRSPTKMETLVVIQPQAPVRLCMLGPDGSSTNTWSGVICDSDEVSRSCPMFTPGTSPEQAREDFLNLLENDEYVFDNYKDLAALQWVIDDRIHKTPFSLWDRVVMWFHSKLFWLKKSEKRKELPLPSDLWS